jgi:hypothetical protein
MSTVGNRRLSPYDEHETITSTGRLYGLEDADYYEIASPEAGARTGMLCFHDWGGYEAVPTGYTALFHMTESITIWCDERICSTEGVANG